MRVYVTGGGPGFSGGHVVRELRELGYEPGAIGPAREHAVTDAPAATDGRLRGQARARCRGA